MRKLKQTATNIDTLMHLLESKDGIKRQHAREELVELGTPAVSSLTRVLQNSPLDQVRWEAAKSLGAIGDARAIPALVKALEDKDPDVNWLAAKALKAFKKAAWIPLLQLLMKSGSDSVILRQGAHHVLMNQKEDGFNDLLTVLIKALEPAAPAELTPQASRDILRRMKAI